MQKIAIHSYPYVTKAGHEYLGPGCARYCVAIGENPVGPRGGTHGRFVKARWASREFRKFEDAVEFARNLARETGAEIIASRAVAAAA